MLPASTNKRVFDFGEIVEVVQVCNRDMIRPQIHTDDTDQESVRIIFHPSFDIYHFVIVCQLVVGVV